MPFTAQAELTIAAPVAAVFEPFIDFRTWGQWMAPVLAPVRGPERPLRAGDRLFVRINGAIPSALTVDRVEPQSEVCWSGGIPGLLFARHSFFFEPAGAQATLIRSVEPWTGLLTSLGGVSERLKRAAEQGGRRQLAGFERWFLARGRTPA